MWIFPKDERTGRKKSPEKILRETDMYTVRTDEGDRDLTLEQGLSRIEKGFSKLRRNKIGKRLPLSEHEHLNLCMFAASMVVRTKAHAEHTSGQWARVLELGEKMQRAMENATPEQRARMASTSSSHGANEGDRMSMEEVRKMVEQPIQETLVAMNAEIAKWLLTMPSLIVETSTTPGFITSDAPSVWYDPANYANPRPRWAGGLMSPTIEITLPLSPTHLLYFSRKHVFPGIYLPVPGLGLVDSLNARTRAFAHEFFVANKPETRAEWF